MSEGPYRRSARPDPEPTHIITARFPFISPISDIQCFHEKRSGLTLRVHRLSNELLQLPFPFAEKRDVAGFYARLLTDKEAADFQRRPTVEPISIPALVRLWTEHLLMKTHGPA